MSGEDLTKWNQITELPILEFLFKLSFLQQLGKKRLREAQKSYSNR